MNYSKAVATSSKENKNVKRTDIRNSAPKNRSDDCNQYNAHFSRKQSIDKSSLERGIVRRPPGNRNVLQNYGQTKSQCKREESLEEKKRRLEEQLNKFESPFIWKPRQVKPFNEPNTIIRNIKVKDSEIKDERKFKWRNFIFRLVIGYELYRGENISEAYEIYCILECILKDPTNRHDYMFTCIEDALAHVIMASKAFLLLKQDLITEAENQVLLIQPVECMTRQNQAAIHGIKAAMFMEYGHHGNKHALKEASEAVSLDRTCPEWHFFISKCLGRIRRVAACYELVDPEEVKAINAAVKLDERNGTYKAFLGQVLSERAFREYKKHYPKRQSDLFVKLAKTNKAAYHCFNDAVKLNPDSPHILIRCAKGMMKLPPQLKNLKFIKECIDKAVELAANNPMVHHVHGMYSERYDVDVDICLQAYEKAASLGNFSAAMDLIRLRFKLQKCSDVVQELETLTAEFEQVDKLQVIYTQAGSYLLFIKKDVVGAFKYYIKAIDIDPNSYAMMSHKPMFFRLRDPVNMFDVLLQELKTNTDWKSFPPEDQRVFQTFTIKASEHAILPTDKKTILTVNDILELSRKVVNSVDMYKENKKAGKRRRAQKNRDKKRWAGKKKPETKDNKGTSSTNNGKEKPSLKPEIGIKRNNQGKSLNVPFEMKRKDSASSINSVDSDYVRDSTVHGTRGFFLGGSTESLDSTRSDALSKYRDLQCHSSMQASLKDNSQLGRLSRDSSISSVSSSYSNDYQKSVGILSIENVKKFNSENPSCISRQEKSLSSAGSLSQASSSNTLSVMDRVKNSYRMLSYKNQPTHGKKKHFEKCESTQSLNIVQNTEQMRKLRIMDHLRSGSSQSLNIEQNTERMRNLTITDENRSISSQNLNIQHNTDRLRDLKITDHSRSGSLQNLNTQKEKLQHSSSETFNPKFTSRSSSLRGPQSFSIMPSFARKSSQIDSNKS